MVIQDIIYFNLLGYLKNTERIRNEKIAALRQYETNAVDLSDNSD